MHGCASVPGMMRVPRSSSLSSSFFVFGRLLDGVSEISRAYSPPFYLLSSLTVSVLDHQPTTRMIRDAHCGTSLGEVTDRIFVVFMNNSYGMIQFILMCVPKRPACCRYQSCARSARAGYRR
jgi:hypothetical protein